MNENYQSQYNAPVGVYVSPPGSGQATAALVLGIISLVLCWTGFGVVLSLPGGIVGAILGAQARRILPPGPERGQATAGFICSLIALALSLLILLVVILFIVMAVSISHSAM